MAIANLAMATGNLGRPGVGVNPLRGQNNVQGACDMGSFPHELTGYRHISGDAVRETLRERLGRGLDPEPGLRIPNMLDAAVDGSFKGLYVQGEDILQSDPNTRHVAAGLAAMECVVVHDLFLNETANYAHVFLPGSTFLEKDGTFTNAERRIQRVRKVMAPKNGYADWEITQKLSNALGYPMAYGHPSEIMDEIAALTPTFAGVSFDRLDELGSIQWPCNASAPEGTPVMHVGAFARGEGLFILTEYVATDEKTGPRYPLLLTTGRILSQYNVGAQTRRTANVIWHEEDRLEIHPARRRGARRARRRLGQAGEPRRRDHPARPDHRARRAGRGLHHLPPPLDPGQRGHHRVFRLGHQLPGIQGHGRPGLALQRPLGLAGERRGAQSAPAARRRRPGGVRAAVDPARLVYMANQIGKFFHAQGEGAAGAGVEDHLRKFWDPRMRREIVTYLQAGGAASFPPPAPPWRAWPRAAGDLTPFSLRFSQRCNEHSANCVTLQLRPKAGSTGEAE